jgi:N-acetylglucosamine kinase-like BadF-type ATPase
MNDWLVGIDAGGTTTRGLAFDPTTGRRLSYSGAGANWTAHGSDACRAAIAAALRAVQPDDGRFAAVCACVAGFYPPDHRGEIGGWAPECSRRTVFRIEPDMLGGWASAFPAGAGVLVIAGTGSICYGRNRNGLEARSGGWGPLFGDQGSAYAIGVDGLRAIAAEIDGYGMATALSRTLPAALPHHDRGLEPPREWLRGIYRHGWDRERVAAAAPHVFDAGEKGDPVAAAIVEGACGSLARQALAVLQGIGEMSLPVALRGGLPTHRRGYAERVLMLLRDGGWAGEEAESGLSPVEGAVLLAAQAIGGDAWAAEVAGLLGAAR